MSCRSLVTFNLYGTVADSSHFAVKAMVHELNSIGTSLLFKKNFAVQQVIRAGTWVSQTRSPHSISGMSPDWSMDMSYTAPVVTAQQVV